MNTVDGEDGEAKELMAEESSRIEDNSKYHGEKRQKNSNKLKGVVEIKVEENL